MKNKTFCLLAVALVLLTAATEKSGVMTREDGMYVVNTTELSKDVLGYQSTTPVKIYVKGDVIQRVEALPNDETPKYFIAAKKKVLPQWEGMKVKQAQKAQIDGRTGATYSSDALIKNVQLGLDYYRKNK